MALAKANGAPVVAIDPESEGKPRLDKMSADDRQIVSLWLLSMTTAGTERQDPGCTGEEVPGAGSVAGGSRPEVTRRQLFLRRARRRVFGQASAPPARAAYRAPRQKPVVSELPHTASDLPLSWVGRLQCTGCRLFAGDASSSQSVVRNRVAPPMTKPLRRSSRVLERCLFAVAFFCGLYVLATLGQAWAAEAGLPGALAQSPRRHCL